MATASRSTGSRTPPAPVYVHAKVCIVDDTWATIGSDNFNRRSWTHDSELTAAVLDDTRDPRAPRDPGGLGDGARTYARELRLQLIREHLDRRDDDGLVDPLEAFAELRRSATALQAWYDDDRVGPRPPGRLRPLVDPALSTTTKRWATQAYHRLYDPDGRPRALRRRSIDGVMRGGRGTSSARGRARRRPAGSEVRCHGAFRTLPR